MRVFHGRTPFSGPRCPYIDTFLCFSCQFLVLPCVSDTFSYFLCQFRVFPCVLDTFSCFSCQFRVFPCVSDTFSCFSCQFLVFPYVSDTFSSFSCQFRVSPCVSDTFSCFFVSVSGVSLCFRHVSVLFVSVSCRRAANIRNIYDGSTFRVMWPSYLFSFSKFMIVFLILSLFLVRFRSLARLILSICICLSATLLTDGL